MKRNNLEAMDLLVKTTPLEVKGHLFSIVAMTDISHEKRRETLEHVFFHDFMNTIASINLFADVLNSKTDLKEDKNWKNLVTGFKQLKDMLRSQVEWMAAENGELEPRFEDVDANLLIDEVVKTLDNRFKGHKITVKRPKENIVLKTDSGLLRRVLENMILNALEASEYEDKVTVCCGLRKDHAEFSVHNSCYIEKDLQLQLFQRSFSTKGLGRGLGTYSMKLLSERYLNGTISFKSSPKNGTTFVARYPLKPNH